MRNIFTNLSSRISRQSARRSGAARTVEISRALALSALIPAFQGSAESIRIRVTVENLAPENGALLTPPWIALHNGGFDVFTLGEPATPELERLAEDGNTQPLSDLFTTTHSGTQTTLNDIGPIPPGASVSATLEVDSSTERFLSYTSMIIPSNDAFIGNEAPQSHEIFSEGGEFLGLDVGISAGSVLDAGTEVNDEIPENTAALAQAAPNTGEMENAMVMPHPGHLTQGSGGIVDQPQFANADFSMYDGSIARIRVEQVDPRPVYLEINLANMAPENGVFLTPVWIGVHDGSFDFVDIGSPVNPELERLAEDGDTGPLSDLFAVQQPNGVQQTVANAGEAPVYSPGSSQSVVLKLDATDPSHRYLSFASMVIPSNDAFIANDDPTAYPLFDAFGNFNSLTVMRMGAQVYDAGTEVNSESSDATAFFGQSAPNTGMEENGVARLHEGFMPVGQGGILDALMFSMADFTADDYPLFQLSGELALSVSEFHIRDGQFFLSWQGGAAPFQVEWTDAIGAAWNPVGAPTDAHELSAPIDGSMRFLRVRSIPE